MSSDVGSQAVAPGDVSHQLNSNLGVPEQSKPPTLLQVVGHLEASIKAALAPALVSSASNGQRWSYDASLLHRLAVKEAEKLELPYELLGSTLSAFEAQVLANTGVDGQGQGQPNEKLRLLALAREYSALQLQEHAGRDGQELAKRVLDRRRRYRFSFPFTPPLDATVPEILESIAKACGLEVFPGAEEDGMLLDATTGLDEHGNNAGLAQASGKSTTLTIAGKGIVIDVDIEGTDRVRAARFSYGLDGSTDQGIDKLLSKQGKAADWETLRNTMQELARMDALETAQSPFAAMKALALKAGQLFEGELEVAPSPKDLLTAGHGLCALNSESPYLSMVYHLPAMHFVSKEWDEALQSGCQADAVSRLLKQSGSRGLRFEVETGVTAPVVHARSPSFLLHNEAPGGLEDKVADGLGFVARLDEPLLITPAVGQRLEEILLGRSAPTSTSTLQKNVQVPHHQAFTGLHLPAVVPGNVYDVSIPEDSTFIHASLSTSAQRSKGFQITRLPFQTMSQLLCICEELRIQCLFNELLSNLFEDARPASAQDEETVSLEDLLQGSSSSQPITANIHPTLTAYPPSLHALFLLPLLPGQLPVSIAFTVTPSCESLSGYQLDYRVEDGSVEMVKRISEVIDKDDGRAKLETELGTSRDLRLVVRWLLQRFDAAA